MKYLTSIAFLLAALGAPTPALSGVVYDNSTTDTLQTYLYSVGAYTQIGDVVELGGTERTLTDASVQFFNQHASGGTFDAVLRLYEAGPSVGALLGTFQLSGLSIDGFGIRTATFGGLNLTVPDRIAFAVEVANVVGGLDLGLNVFEPPTVGTSSDTHVLVDTGSGLVDSLASAGGGNLYFVANAVPVPEPAALGLVGIGLALVARASRRR